MNSNYYSKKNLTSDYLLENEKHLCFKHQVCELQKVVSVLKEKLKILKNSRYIAQQTNKNLIQQLNQLAKEIKNKTIIAKDSIRSQDEITFEVKKWSQLWFNENRQKILANKQLLENAEQVKVIEKQIEYTNRLIEHKRKMISGWQNVAIQKVYKENQLKTLEQENMDMGKKMTEWLKINQRLLSIFEMIKDREVEMIFGTERCKQRNEQAREECNKLQTQILMVSKTLDDISQYNIINLSSSSIILHKSKE